MYLEPGKSQTLFGTSVCYQANAVLVAEWIEVVEAIESRTEVPDLREALAHLSEAQQVMDSILDCCQALLSASAVELGSDGMTVAQSGPGGVDERGQQHL